MLALTLASLDLGLQHLDIRFMTKGTNNYFSIFEKFHKAWKKGKSPPSLKDYSFEEDTELCVVTTLEECLKEKKFGRERTKISFY